MNPRIVGVGALIAVLCLAILAILVGFGGDRASALPQGPTDLVVYQAYQVADFRSCKLADGSLATEWHFGGADRSRRNQLTPALDGRGRPIFRVVTNNRNLPAGHMRLRMVAEADPTLEGFKYGDYSWNGIVVEYNGRVEDQRIVGPCGPDR
ncbi:MAG: hypothetical protein A2915_02545 [Candidatus Yanofskybacteria bacterium RIFCSPLOWO2_01_FULL_41_34]|uniref:Uncharacterized protein n=1 Tax=Candidatus Yanofskybacteria bacterium RIFCSPHIGHO2_01_FULL_41_26 TaxID=1802661 RepID=A0A1F8EEJ8_9BACT|nr:MAG: hypothetical protein A2649_04045 [Candidatus Yanofskybacteria bacterium RIFCSPHIGHO2_01_FULL_41_26]OGN20916.1 MAG: hypothetical protein A2915_02545 [Candidatus Yanofskybacteria bacterium RIFCSPLOWO2_01_FULL_41_34]